MVVKLNIEKANAQIKSRIKSKRGSILIVDDERENLDGLSALLDQDYNVYSTSSPTKAIEIVGDQEIDMVISDQRMPELLGTELLARLREIQPYQIRILLTGYADIQDLIGCVNQGLLYRYLVKPWIPNDLLNTIQQAFDKLDIEYQLKRQAEALEQEVNERRETQNHLERALKELKETQEVMIAQERLKVLGEMVSGIAHDFSNILTPIHAYCEELITDLSADPVISSNDKSGPLEPLLYIRYAVEDGRALIERLRAAYAPKYKVTMPKHTQISTSKLIKEALALAIPRWEPHLPTIQINSSIDENTYVYGEYSELRQALVNLICNAIDAMREIVAIQAPVLSIQGGLQEDFISIRVCDNGQGMSPEVLERCQELFFSTKGDQGTGLGLHMVYQTVKRHQGKLLIASELMQGTQVQINLPTKE